MDQLSGLFWFVLMLVPLIFLQRFLHREIQAVFLIISRDARVTMTIFQLIFLPGVFLHEGSHFLMAKLLGVPTGRFSILPRPLPNGRLQLGYVETARSDIVRGASDHGNRPGSVYRFLPFGNASAPGRPA
jgi:hypothetical protein